MRRAQFILLTLWSIIGLSLMPGKAAALLDSSDSVDENEYTSDTFYEEEEYYTTNDSIFSFIANDTIDKSAFKERQIDPSSWKSVTNTSDYKYKKEQPKVAKERSLTGFEQFLISLFQFFASTAGKVLLWLIFGVLVLVVSYYIFKQYGLHVFKSKSRALKPLSIAEEEEIIPQDWEVAINEAVSKQDFRGAVRLSYRHIVFLLQEKGVIGLTNANSNRQFLAALRTKPYFAQFSALLLHYEYLWYGQYKIEANSYIHIEKVYQSIKNQL